MQQPNDLPFWRRRWYVFVAALVLLCICIAVIVAVTFVLPERFFAGLLEDNQAVEAPTAEPATGPDTETGSEPSPTPQTVAEEPSDTPLTLSGYYGASIFPFAGNLEHALFILLHRWMGLLISESSISIEGPEPWVNVTGDLAEDGVFTATGRGTVAGFPDIAVVFEGTVIFDEALDNYTLAGDLTMGAEGGLPGGQPIIYRVEGFRLGPLEGAPLETEIETLESFVPALVDAVHSQDTAFLIERTHPAALAFYGEETCRAYIEGLNDPGFNIEPAGTSGEESWLWEREGLTAFMPQTFYVVADVTTGGQTDSSEIHFAPVNGQLAWFPDCGEPAP